MNKQFIAIQNGINDLREDGIAVGDLSDGYHSFNDLYAHRIELAIALGKAVQGITGPSVWISKKQSDGKDVEAGWMLLGIGTKAGKQITYHIPADRWSECKKFATPREEAPEYDGHTSADVLKRLAEL